jgi:hypothetical protein
VSVNGLINSTHTGRKLQKENSEKYADLIDETELNLEVLLNLFYDKLAIFRFNAVEINIVNYFLN